jgi:serine/threonine protein kinase
MPIGAEQLMADLIGKTLGQYRIVRELGRGGMAIVYEAYQPALNRTVAIKVLPPSLSADATFVHRFLREARAAARLEHPNIVAIYDVQDFGGIYGIVMQKLAGVPLDALVRRNGRLPQDRAVHILGQIASALDYAHSYGIVHRDVKPTNIMVGPGDRAWLTDFGLAQAATGTQLSQTRSFAGTPKYMSPEQANGWPVGPPGDIYSLGIVLYYMLASRTPFEAETAHTLLYQQVYEAPPPIHSFAPDLPVETETVLARALAKDPSQRFVSAMAMHQALLAVARNAIPAQASKKSQRWISLTVGAVSLLVGALLLWLSRNMSPSQPPFVAATPTLIAAPPATLPPTPIIGATARPVAATATSVRNAAGASPTRLLPTDTTRPTQTPTPLTLWADLRVYRLTRAETEALPSMWKLAVYRDMFTPGTNTYRVTVRSADVYRWGFSWHARNQVILQEILQPLKVELLINGVRVPESLIHAYEDTTDDGWVGQRWVTAIGDWPAGKTVVLEARYELSHQVHDGQNAIAPGLYHQIIYVAVQ